MLLIGRPLATVLETTRFQLEFLKLISMMYHNFQAVLQVNGKRSEAFVIERSVEQDCPLSLLFYVLALKFPLHGLREEKACPALHSMPPVAPLLAKVSAFADDITIFVSCSLDIKAVKVVTRYEQIAGAKITLIKVKVCG